MKLSGSLLLWLNRSLRNSHNFYSISYVESLLAEENVKCWVNKLVNCSYLFIYLFTPVFTGVRYT